MSKPFLGSNPSPDELRALIKYLSTFRDGSGNIRENDQIKSTRADARQIERCLAEIYGVKPLESKSYYDFLVPINSGGGVVISAASVKSKELASLLSYRLPGSRKKLRAHLEISNASAKDWSLCQARGLTEEDFREGRNAEEFGQVILDRQSIERQLAEKKLQKKKANTPETRVDPGASAFISVMYSPMDNKGQRSYLVSSYPIVLQPPRQWIFRGKALVGIDEKGGMLYEWYALSGSQFKYYPLISSRTYGSNLFQLLIPAQESLHQKAIRMFGHA